MNEIIPSTLIDFESDIHGNEFRFRDNHNLKGKNALLPYTKDHVDEMRKCKDDIFYFLFNYYKVVHQDHGLIKLEVRDYQAEIIQNFLDNRFSISVLSRQSGKTTAVVGYILHFILFKTHKTVAILANKAAQAREIFSRLQLAYENLPYWLQQGVMTYNKGSLHLENGCRVMISATSGDAIRGQSIGLLFIDEVAAIQANLWNDFYEAVYPTVSSSKEARIILVSTPKGHNHFWKLWVEAKNGQSNYSPLLKTYKDIPQYNNQAFIDETVANIGPRKFNQEYGASFLASSTSLIDGPVLENIPLAKPLQNTELHNILPAEILRENINTYKLKEKNHVYVIGVDPAKITEESSGDSVALQVLDITTYPYEQVCSFSINTGIHYLQLPEFLSILGNYYNGGTMFIEQNDQIGLSICDALLYEYEYEGVYSEKPGTNGFRTTTKTKKIGCLNLKMLIEESKLVLYDFATISEISTFVQKGNSYQADKGCSDDLVMSLIHTLFFLQDHEYEDERNKLMNKTKPNIIKPTSNDYDDSIPIDMFSSQDEAREYEQSNFWK